MVLSVGLIAACSGAGRQSNPPPLTSPTAPATTVATVTATTADPGTLPQTMVLPNESDPAFQSRVQALWKAIVDGNPTEGLVAFFPLSAYVQVKAIADPVHDYRTRLIANYEQDIESLHATVQASGGDAAFASVRVPPAAQWIRPGVEYNKGSYWRVYGTAVTYVAGGQSRTFEIHSLISWRGEWYVVHLGAIR